MAAPPKTCLILSTGHTLRNPTTTKNTLSTSNANCQSEDKIRKESMNAKQ